jgi:hypothetical protein
MERQSSVSEVFSDVMMSYHYLMMEAEKASGTLDYSSILTRLVAGEDFIAEIILCLSKFLSTDNVK